MFCKYCDLEIGKNYRNHGTVYCQCGETHDLEGKIVTYLGKNEDDYHVFRVHGSVWCSCDRQLNKISIPCQDGKEMESLRNLFCKYVEAT